MNWGNIFGRRMKKISLEVGEPSTAAVETSVPANTDQPKKMKKILLIVGLVAAVLLLIGGLTTLLVGLPALAMKDQAAALTPEAQQAYEAFQAQDLKGAIAKLAVTRQKYEELGKTYAQLAWTRVIPWVGEFYQDGEHLLAGGRHLLDAADVTVVALQPYADILGLDQSEANPDEEKQPLTAEKRLLLMLDTLEKIEPSLDEIGQKLQADQSEVDQIDPQRYPQEIRGVKIRQKVIDLVQTIDNTAVLVMEAKPIVNYIRPLLGVPDEKRYLLLFQNDAELRPTGGFLTAYAILSVQDGNFKPLGSYDIYGLDGRFGNRLPAPEPIKKYHKNVYYWHLRDMNLSPDFSLSMATFWENYQKAGGPRADGIIALDTQFLVNILEILGPVGVGGWGQFSAENDPRCDCPQVIYELEKIADKPLGEIKTDRKAVLGPLMHSIMLNIMQSPKKKWPEFFNAFFTNIKEKHLLFYFFDEELQKTIEVLNAGGRIRQYDGDYLHINDANFAGAKSNLFIRVNVDQQIEVQANGEVIKTVTIDYRNPAPASDCGLESGGLCLNALYRDWIRLYVPQGSELLDSSGSETTVNTYEELDKTVFEAFYGDQSPLRPEGKAQVMFKYKLPFKVDQEQGYKLLIQKQPGTYGYEYTVSYDGQQKTFALLTDQEIKF